MPRYTKDYLQLYDMPGAGMAAREISKVLNAARAKIKKQVKRSSWRRDEEVKTAGKIVGAVYSELVYPILSEQGKFGAWDSESRYAAQQALVDAAKEKLGFDKDEPCYELADWML